MRNFSSLILYAAVVILHGCVSLKQVLLTQEQRSLNEKTTLVWSPFIWHAELSKEVESLQLQEVNLVVQNLKTHSQIPLPLETKAATSRILLNNNHQSIEFYLKTPFTLPEGDYSWLQINSKFLDPITQRIIAVSIPIPTLSETIASLKAMSFKVKSTYVAALPRTIIETQFIKENSALSSKSSIHFLDTTGIPVNIVLDQLQKQYVHQDQVIAASNQLPRWQLSLSKDDGSPIETAKSGAKIGFLIEVPCDAKGTLKINWKKLGDNNDYYTLLPLHIQILPEQNETTTQCDKVRTLKNLNIFPEGEWMMKSLNVKEWQPAQEIFTKHPWLKTSDTNTSYLGFASSLANFFEDSKQHDITKQFVVRVNPKSYRENEILFMGKFKLQKTVSEKNEDMWEILFQRNFNLSEIQTFFKINDIFNAYTTNKVTRDRTQGNIQSILKISAEENALKHLENASNYFRKTATEKLAECFKEREEFDPLVNVEGVLTFNILKGEDMITFTSFSFKNGGESEKRVEECYKKKLLNFRFKTPVVASFQGELSFGSQ